jgi:hypothetical protein
MEEIELRPGETMVRCDVVHLGLSPKLLPWLEQFARARALVWRFTAMSVTGGRIIFSKEDTGWLGAVAGALGPAVYRPLRTPIQLELSEIRRFWKWRQEFSGPPAFQVEGTADLWYFRLLVGRRFPYKYAPIEAMREHFETVEAAWAAAKARAAVHAPTS